MPDIDALTRRILGIDEHHYPSLRFFCGPTTKAGTPDKSLGSSTAATGLAGSSGNLSRTKVGAQAIFSRGRRNAEIVRGAPVHGLREGVGTGLSLFPSFRDQRSRPVRGFPVLVFAFVFPP